MRRYAPLSIHPRRDPRRYRFAMPNAVWEYTLRPVEFVLLSYLCCHRAHVLDLNMIATGVHLTVNTIKKHLASLRAKGLVTDELTLASGLQNTYNKNFFTLPEEIFLLELPPSAFLVYAYLLLVEDRRTHTCHSSIRTIAAATYLAVSTVVKSVNTLAERKLISVERTAYYDKHGMKWTGNNLYTLLPTRAAVANLYQEQLARLELESERERVRRRQAEYDRRHPREPLCETGTTRPDPCPTGDRDAPVKALRGTKKEAGDEKKGRINAWRRKRPPAGSHLPAVRAVSRGPRVVGSDICFRQKNGL